GPSVDHDSFKTGHRNHERHVRRRVHNWVIALKDIQELPKAIRPAWAKLQDDRASCRAGRDIQNVVLSELRRGASKLPDAATACAHDQHIAVAERLAFWVICWRVGKADHWCVREAGTEFGPLDRGLAAGRCSRRQAIDKEYAIACICSHLARI